MNFSTQSVAQTVRPELSLLNRPKGVGGYFFKNGISKKGTIIERHLMKLTLETTIGTVIYELDGHFIHVYTDQESAREFSLNLWNHATREMRIETSIDDVFLEVAEALSERFPRFQVDSLLVNYAPFEDLLKSALIQAYGDAMKRLSETESV